MITEFSLRNPLVVWGITAGLCLFGLFAYFTLGVAVTPNVNIAAVVVTTAYPPLPVVVPMGPLARKSAALRASNPREVTTSAADTPRAGHSSQARAA